jgi:hypothetical protein
MFVTVKFRETETYYNFQNDSYKHLLKKKKRESDKVTIFTSSIRPKFFCVACCCNYFAGNSSRITALSNLWYRTNFLVIKKPEGRGAMLKIYGTKPHFPKIPLG